jgi:hypothetical protein
MRYLALSVFTLLFYSACSGDDIISTLGLVDSKITEREAEARDYNLRTPGFEMQVAIRDDVDEDTQYILDLLDEMAADFLECQFMSYEIGTHYFQIESGETVPPLSMLRVLVVPYNFECDAIDKDMCAGIFFPDSDIIVISQTSFGRCGDFPLWKHELGHRYGMASDHSNQEEFEPCIDPPDC